MNKKNVYSVIGKLAIMLIFILIPNLVQAKKYDPNDIISDLLFRYKKMKAVDIQRFLENKSSGLKDFSMSVFGKIKKASEIIFDASRTYDISEAVLLTLMQKEQALITTPVPTQYQLDWATGYGINRERKEEYKGFYNQVHWAAKALGYIYDTWRGQYHWIFDVGKTKETVDGYLITPKNYSTAKLYTYDPYRGGPDQTWGGNWLFWSYWDRWFSDLGLKKKIISGTGPSGGPQVRTFYLNTKADWKTNFFAYSENFHGGVRVASGDVDGDGQDEIITGAGPGGGGQVRVFDPDGLFEPEGKVKKYARSLLDFWPFGENFSGGVDVAAGDVDQDGIDEIAMSQLSLGQCWVKVYKFNEQRTILGEFRVFPASFKGGCTIALGDVDGDQKDEVIVGSGKGMPSKVEVWKPWGKKMEIDFWPFHPNYQNGVDVASADCGENGDDEIVVSQREKAQAWVKVYDYRPTKDVLLEFKAYGDYSCGANVTASDLDGDGKMEIVTGPGIGGGPHLRVFDLEGKPKLGLFAYDEKFRGGSDVAVGVFEK